MAQLFTNNAVSLLEYPIDSSSLVLQVIPGTGHLYPQPVAIDDFFLLTLEKSPATDNEIIKIIGRNGDMMQVAPGGRGYEHTAARSWDASDVVDHRVTAGTLQSLLPAIKEQNITVYHSTTGLVDSVYVAPTRSKSLKWQVILTCPSLDKAQTFELFALVKNPTTPIKWTKSAILGDKVSVDINITIVNSNVQLNIHNNEAADISVDFVRIIT